MVVLLVVLLALALAPATALAGPVPEGAEWSQTYVATPDGESLHVDVLRPKGLPEDARTPVIAVISPYLGHAADGTGNFGEPGPSNRFNDFIEGARLFERGWTVVLADLRGTGGSTGCLDILGPGEQTDIKSVVEWAADQPWSTGRVAMYGKSYDGNTGVAAAAIRPRGLAAVVGQQVVGDRYRGSYSGGVRYLQSLAYPSVSYGSGGEAGFTFSDDPGYIANSLARSADCQAGLAGHYDPDPQTEFWKVRDFVERAKGSTVPYLMTTGFLDTNTNIGAGAIDFFNTLEGPKRLWLGWWDHVRGNDMAGDQLAMGRAGWFDEVMRFLDEHVRGVKPAVADPPVVLQDSSGVWRAEQAWPPADATPLEAPLKAGSYDDDGLNVGSGDAGAGAGGATAPGRDYSPGNGIWTVSPPLPHNAHVAGIPSAIVDAAAPLPDANVAVNLYAIAPDGRATMISRGASLIAAEGPTAVEMYPAEWSLPAGHRIGVLVSGSNAEAWIHVPTHASVTVAGGSVRIPFLRYDRAGDPVLPGLPAARLATYKEAAPFELPPPALEAVEGALVPPALQARPAPGPVLRPAPRRKVTARLRVRGRRAVVTGRAAAGARVRVTLLRGSRRIARRTVTASGGRFRVRFKVRGPARRLRARAAYPGSPSRL
jgi:uncharacterized protein